MNSKSIIIFFLLGIAVFLYSCKDEDIYKGELYKNVFALISDEDNITAKYFPFGKETVGFVSASMGGTEPTEKEVVVHLVEDKTFLDEFNKRNFEDDVSKYAKLLPKKNYTIEEYQLTIPAGEINGRMPVKINPDGLSPDSIYALSLRVESFSSYEINVDKSFLLYNVRVENKWANSDGTVYNMRVKLRNEGSDVELEAPGSQIMHPISANQVRVMAANVPFSPTKEYIEQGTLLLTIDTSSNDVTITPFKYVEVEQIDGDDEFPNSYSVVNDGFKDYGTFLLHYKVNIPGEGIVEVKEELRLEIKEDNPEDN